VAAAALAGVVWWRMVSGYDGAALAWLGLGSIGFVIVGANIADHQGGGPGEH
jgi:dihydrodipicolinate synthase/N-acetylneuraminate lyase